MFVLSFLDKLKTENINASSYTSSRDIFFKEMTFLNKRTARIFF